MKVVDNHNGEQANFSFSVSLWRNDKLLGWYRPKAVYPEGMLLNSVLDNLKDNNIVTVWFELKKQGVYTFHRSKALVHQQADATELLWVNQHADLTSLIPYIALPPAGKTPRWLFPTARHVPRSNGVVQSQRACAGFPPV